MMSGWWAPAAFSLALYVYTCTFRSYIHPDEFFQSSEVISGGWFDIVHYTPWEFTGTAPCRSVFFPMLLFTASGSFLAEPGGSIFLYRAIMALLFVILICYFRYMLSMFSKNTSCLPLMLSPIWYTFMLRPFSNSIEVYLLAGIIMLSFPGLTPKGKIGVYLAMGFFNRPTFAFFAVVPTLSWLYNVLVHCPRPAERRRLIVHNLLLQGAGTSLFLVALDTVYFSYHNRAWTCGSNAPVPAQIVDWTVHKLTGCSPSSPLSIVLTPLNWLHYNMHSSNLAEHGIHPRITHIAVYMPMLFGVLAGIFFAFCAHWLLYRDLKSSAALFIRSPSVISLHAFHGGLNWRNEPQHSWQENEWQTVKHATYLLTGTILVPLLALSTAPHQEARFLLPLAVPLIIGFAHHILNSRLLLSLSIVHCVLLSIFFGILHQGGVIPGLQYQRQHLRQVPFAGRQVHYQHHLLYYKTYMPPRTLLAWPRALSSRLHVHDLAGSPREKLHSLVNSLHNASTQSPSMFHVWLMTPCSVRMRDWAYRTRTHLNITVEARFGPHLSMEDPPHLLTREDCILSDSHCHAATERHYAIAPVLNFLQFSMRMCLYRIEFHNATCSLPAGAVPF
ncbi:GPI mannosyltransferase 4-like [Sycon ciliatum]|uniref:GPI mannosyltransferase 4-like n=1 Tax=Sycon ciliatum TaxID=27933 RepID=UPI0020AD26A2|eukprot:scpid50586/ scgid24267/ GPI mannosyltransferase 4; GPI mannosyltransferase IV; Phosphatidylinositol-glycan biosynthesis class Z protein; SMP3 homolog